LKLKEIVTHAKYHGLQSIVGIRKPPKLSSWLVSDEERDRTNKGSSKKSGLDPKQLKTTTKSSLQDPAARRPVSSSTSAVTEPTADGDIPMFFRKFASKYPFGNVHMALR